MRLAPSAQAAWRSSALQLRVALDRRQAEAAKELAMWWTKGLLGTALLVLGFLVIQPAIMQRLAAVLGL